MCLDVVKRFGGVEDRLDEVKGQIGEREIKFYMFLQEVSVPTSYQYP